MFFGPSDIADYSDILDVDPDIVFDKQLMIVHVCFSDEANRAMSEAGLPEICSRVYEKIWPPKENALFDILHKYFAQHKPVDPFKILLKFPAVPTKDDVRPSGKQLWVSN